MGTRKGRRGERNCKQGGEGSLQEHEGAGKGSMLLVQYHAAGMGDGELMIALGPA